MAYARLGAYTSGRARNVHTTASIALFGRISSITCQAGIYVEMGHASSIPSRDTPVIVGPEDAGETLLLLLVHKH